MRIYVHHLYQQETQVLEGTEEQLDAQLAELFPEQAADVDPDEGLTELIDHLNHEIQGVDLELEGAEELAKAQTPPDFPKLGVESNRRETPYVTSMDGVRLRQQLTMNNAVHADPDFQGLHPKRKAQMAQRFHERNEEDRGESGRSPPRGAVGVTPGTSVSYARAGDALRWHEGDHKTSIGVKNHEDFHQMMKRVEAAHGKEARINLGRNLLQAIPKQYRETLEQYHEHQTKGSYKNDPIAAEETLARLFNYTNAHGDRSQAVRELHEDARGRVHPVQMKAFDIRMKRALRSLQAASEVAHEKWLTPNFIKAEDGGMALPPEVSEAPAPTPVKTRRPRATKLPEGPNLVAVHNLTAGNVLHAHALGGLAAPSLAITHKDHPMANFGDISLVAHHDLIDPAKGTPVYEADIYSPRHPKASYRINQREHKAFKAWAAPHAKRMGDHSFSSFEDEMERGGADRVMDTRSLRAVMGLGYLEENGRAPSTMMKPKSAYADFLAHPIMQEFYADKSHDHEHARNFDPGHAYYQQFSDTANKALHAWAQDVGRENNDPALGDDLVDTYKDWWSDHEGKPSLSVGKYDQMVQGMRNAKQMEPDTRALETAVEEQMQKEDPNAFKKWSMDKLRPVEGEPYISKMSAAGNRRKLPYNLHTVLKEMTRQIRQGENFNYGLGTARAAGAKRFKSLDQMRQHRHKIVSKEQFDAQKKLMDDRFGSLSDTLRRYHVDPGGFHVLDGLAQAIGESYKRGHYLHNELRQSGFNNVPAHVTEKVHQFAHDLLNMPTEYFEAKPQRAVQFHEFKGAVVPVGVDPEVVKVLQNAGLQIEHYKKDDEGARKLAVQAIANQHNLMLSEDDLDADLRKAEGIRTIPPNAEMPSDPNYVYHGTNLYNAHSIAAEGLHVHAPWEGTDQDMWPDGSTEKRSYHSPSIKGVLPFLPNEKGGGYVVLRTPKAQHPFRAEGTGDMYSKEVVPPHKMEILTEQGWHPMQTLAGLKKAAPDVLSEDDENSVEDQHGFRPHLHRAFAAAKFLTGAKQAPDFQVLRAFLLEENGNVERAALKTFGLPVNEENLKALRAVSGFKSLAKGEESYGELTAAIPEDSETQVKHINKSIKAGNIQPIKLGGVHSAGSLLVGNDERHWLLKPGANGPGPASGANEQRASDSKREAAFWHIANVWGLGDDIPRADLVYMNGKEFAAIHMLPFDWKNLSKVQEKDPLRVSSALDRYRRTGQLHQWAMLDFILGNVDRHGQNEMISPEDNIKLIDHGSAFAGPDFDPGKDKNSFIPYYLRAHVNPDTWDKMTSKEKLHAMVTVGPKIEEDLKMWLASLDGQAATGTMVKYGVDPGSTIRRLARVKGLLGKAGSLSENINRLWLTT